MQIPREMFCRQMQSEIPATYYVDIATEIMETLHCLVDRRNMMAERARRDLPMLAKILESVAPIVGAELKFEPTWHRAGQIVFKSGKIAYFRGSSLDINAHGASEIAKDKDYAAYFMQQEGFPAIRGRAFFSSEWSAKIGFEGLPEDSVLYAEKIGYPVIVKPNSSSQGKGVSIANNAKELRDGLHECFKEDKVAIVQPLFNGRDYRVVVLGDRVISAYERIPLSVVGDGISTISRLIERRQEKFLASGRNTKIPIDDKRMDACLSRQGLTRESIPMSDVTASLFQHANLSCGGEAIDITGHLATNFERLCIDVTKYMGLRLCGVDLIVEGDATQAGSKVHIIEVNSSPGLDNYASMGPVQWNRVKALYAEVLNFIENDG
jgi:D-alanine-D-alanine ligase-like ATP-grasp enzyme